MRHSRPSTASTVGGGRARAHTVLLLLGVFAAATAAGGVGAGRSLAEQRATARATRTLSGSDTAHLHLVHAGTLLREEGSTSGVLGGHMRAELDLGAIYTGSFTIEARGGAIKGSGRATPSGAGRYQSFSGWLTVTGGSGVFAHVHGRDRLSGVFDRRTYAVLVQTTGTLSY
jgi:hypothetical protein